LLEGEDPLGDHGLGSLVELRFKAPPGTFIFIYHNPPHRDNVTRFMGVPNLEVGYTSATTGRGDHEVYKGHVVALGEKSLLMNKNNP
jgi:hypothetical protein